MLKQRFTPGVYVQELDAFPNSVVQVPTALPVFVGYTAKASYNGSSLKKKMVKIESLADYVTFFGSGPASQYDVTLIPAPKAGTTPPPTDLTLNGQDYSITPVKSTEFLLYYSVSLFFLNGGSTCYILSIGTYDKEGITGPRLLDFNSDNFNFTDVIATEPDPTMLLIPDALLFPQADYKTIINNSITFCGEAQSLIVLMDAWAGDTVSDPLQFTALQAQQDSNQNSMDPVGQLRGLVANGPFLKHAVAYYPWLNTSVVSASQINMFNVVGGFASSFFEDATSNNGKTLANIKSILSTINGIASLPAPNTPQASLVLSAHNSLLTTSRNYQLLMNAISSKINCLPAAPAVAGCIAVLDAQVGVWQAPANISLNGVQSAVLKINDQMQENMNVDAVTGKSVNVIRPFPGLGVMIWGARTLDGNSQDWRYVSVKRTLIMIEQSIKLAARSYVFMANDENTWLSLQGAIESFLYSIWKQGGLAGAKPEQAYNVQVGIGATMTAQDILDGYLDIAVLVAVTHPAEFIEISFKQQLQQS